VKPFGTLALSDALETPEANPEAAPGTYHPDGFHPTIVSGPRPTLGGNCVWFCEGAADAAKAYGCETVYVWTGFGGERYPAAGYNSNVLDAAEGITLADVRACFAAFASRGVRPGVIIRPQRIVPGVNQTYIDCSNPVGTLLAQASAARACGAMDFYADTLSDECVMVDNKALAPERFAPVVDAFPDATFLVEFWHPGYSAFPKVIHWRDGAKEFTMDRPQAVELEPSAVKAKAQQAAWGKRLRDTGSTVIVNCRPDDPTLPERQAGVIAAWKASQK
jgi:hypothetical protein